MLKPLNERIINIRNMILSDNKNEDNKLKKKFIYSREDHISDLYQIKQKNWLKVNLMRYQRITNALEKLAAQKGKRKAGLRVIITNRYQLFRLKFN